MDISPGLLGSLDESDEAGDTDDDCMIISFFLCFYWNDLSIENIIDGGLIASSVPP